MAQFKATYASGSAAIDWVDLKASSALLDGESSHVVIRTAEAARIAVGVEDPVTSNTAGVATVAGEAVEVILGGKAANQTIWVQTPADQSDIHVEVDVVGPKQVLVVSA